jgi:hypothetical protein
VKKRSQFKTWTGVGCGCGSNGRAPSYKYEARVQTPVPKKKKKKKKRLGLEIQQREILKKKEILKMKSSINQIKILSAKHHQLTRSSRREKEYQQLKTDGNYYT